MKAAKSKSEEFSLQEKNFNYGDMNYNYTFILQYTQILNHYVIHMKPMCHLDLN